MSSLRDVWEELQGTARPADSFTLKLLLSENDVRMFAAVVGAKPSASLVVELPKEHGPRDLKRISTRTFESTLAEFPGLPAGRCAIAIVLRQPEYIDLFALLGEEIVVALHRPGTTADTCRAVVRCIERWRRFVEKDRRSLSEEEVRGLIGELVVLNRVSVRFGRMVAVQSWQGEGGLRDFELPDFTVEVKTYQIDTGATVRINDPLQLEGTPERKAYLGVVRIARAQTHGRTLPEFIAEIEGHLGPDGEATDLFHDRLASQGYLAAQASLFTDRYVATAPRVFEVREGFPRIRPDQVPGSLRDVHFSIILTGVAPFAVDADGLLGASAGLEAE